MAGERAALRVQLADNFQALVFHREVRALLHPSPLLRPPGGRPRPPSALTAFLRSSYTSFTLACGVRAASHPTSGPHPAGRACRRP
jgi:hypothetical protein